jgi:hypothetical protein
MGTLGAGLAACDRPSAPEPPGGGRTIDLDYAYFATYVEPILQARTCSTAGCHGGQGSGMLLLSGGSNPEADFNNLLNHTRPWAPPTSPLLLKPLAAGAGGLVHGGGDIFADTTDTDYRTVLRWIAGERVVP